MRVVCINLSSSVFFIHQCHPLIASRASAECTRYCGAGSTSKRCVHATFLPNGSDKRQQSGLSLGAVWGALRDQITIVLPRFINSAAHCHLSNVIITSVVFKSQSDKTALEVTGKTNTDREIEAM